MLSCFVILSDTDSLIYAQDLNANGPESYLKIGNNLGEWSIQNSECDIVSFHAAAPKSYAIAYKNRDTNEISYEIKAKGFSIKTSAKEITADAIRRIVEDKEEEILISEPLQIHRNL